MQLDKRHIQFGYHKPLHNDDGDPYEYELKPVNGKMIRAFYLCRFCSCLYEANAKTMCIESDVDSEVDDD